MASQYNPPGKTQEKDAHRGCRVQLGRPHDFRVGPPTCWCVFAAALSVPSVCSREVQDSMRALFFFVRLTPGKEAAGRQRGRRRRRRGRRHSMPDQPQEDVTSFKARTHHGSGKKETYELKVRRATKKQLVGEAAAAVRTRSKSLVCLSNSLIWCCDINRTVRPPGSCCCDLCRSVPREEQADRLEVVKNAEDSQQV